MSGVTFRLTEDPERLYALHSAALRYKYEFEHEMDEELPGSTVALARAALGALEVEGSSADVTQWIREATVEVDSPTLAAVLRALVAEETTVPEPPPTEGGTP